MFNKTISSLFVLSLLHTSAAFCMEIDYPEDDKGRSRSSSDFSASSKDSKEDIPETPLIILKKEDYRKHYDDLKESILKKKDYKSVMKSVKKFIKAVGETDPWVEDVIQLMVENINFKYSDSDDSSVNGWSHDKDSGDPFALHHWLLEKIKEPAVHHPSTTTLADTRKVRFSLKSFQAPKMVKLPTVEPDELVRLTQNLIKELEENSNNLSSLEENSNPIKLLEAVMQELKMEEPSTAMDLVPTRNKDIETNSFELSRVEKKSSSTNLLEMTKELLLKTAKKPFLNGFLYNDAPTNVSIKLKLRHLLMMAKELEEKSSTCTSIPESETGLSRASNVIFQLLLNIVTCNTGVEDGIDTAYRLITGGQIVSEDLMEKEHLQENAKEVITEELRKIRENLLNGESPVARHFLNSKQSMDDDDTVHTAKYIKGLLGFQIGTLFEGEKLSCDLDGDIVLEEVREASLQQVLDAFHSYHKPDKVIAHFLEKFNKRDWPFGFIGSLIDPKELKENKYALFENEDPTDDFIGWKPLVVAELLLRLGILEEVSKH